MSSSLILIPAAWPCGVMMPSQEEIANAQRCAAADFDDATTERVVTFADLTTRLVPTCRVIEYRDLPTPEWTI